MSPRERRLLLLCLVLHIGLGSVLGNAPFRSRKSPSAIISKYAVVDPVITYSQTLVKGHHKSLRVVLQGDDENFVLDLELNELLLAPHFCSTYTSQTGEIIREEYPNCFYQGRVEGHPEWRATFSTCFGLRGSFGDHHDSNRHFHLEPLHSNATSIRLEGPHVFYLDTEHKNAKPGTCGTDPSHTIGGNHPSTHDGHGLDLQLQEGKRTKRQLPPILIVELLVVNDFQQYVDYGGDISAVVQRAIEIANEVDMLYESLPLASTSVKISLVESITWTTGNRLDTSSNNANDMLNSFRRYHQSEINQDPNSVPHDSAMLMTGVDLAGTTIGIAFTGTMCNSESGVGITQDLGESAAFVGSTAAHEMGHIFDMAHDDNCCTVPSSQGGCVMNAAASFITAAAWSTCSANELSDGVVFDNLGVCLDNNPTQIVGDPSCGNGILEPGEICDCGSPEECSDPCCAAATCTLASRAQCATGPCCDQCQFVAYGTTCRSAVDGCDILEYCTGDSGQCPENTFRPDGASCDGGNAYCFSGLCVTRDDQCMDYYGETATGSSTQCYSIFNVQGTSRGHCGSTGTQFIPCAPENALCGLIMCQGGPDQPIISFSGSYVFGTSCKTFSTNADFDGQSPSLVKDGTECGTGQICLAQQCVSTSALSAVNCPTGNNGQTCSGNGVCNSRSQCSCSVGFSGTSCEVDLNAPATTSPATASTEAQTTATTASTEATTASTETTTASTEATTSTTSVGVGTGRPDVVTDVAPPENSTSRPSNTTNSSTSDGSGSVAENPTAAAAFEESTGLVIGVVLGVLLVVVAVVAAIAVFIYRKYQTKKKAMQLQSAARHKHKKKTRANTYGSKDDLLKNEFSLPSRSPAPPPPSSRGYSPPRPTRGYSPPQPTRGYSPPRPTRGYSPPRPTRGYSPPRPTRAPSPPQPTRALSPPQPTRGYFPPEPSRELSPPPVSKRISPSSLHTTTTTTFTVNQELRRSPPAPPPAGKKVPISVEAPTAPPSAPLTSFFPPQLPSKPPVIPMVPAATQSHEPVQPATKAPPLVLPPIPAKKPPPVVSTKPIAPSKPVTQNKLPDFHPRVPLPQPKPAAYQPPPPAFQPVAPPPQFGPTTAPKPVKVISQWPAPPPSDGQSGGFGSRGPPPPPKKPMFPPRMM